MSKMGNEAIREAESRSLDNAEQVRRLKADVARLEQEKAELVSICARMADALDETSDDDCPLLVTAWAVMVKVQTKP